MTARKKPKLEIVCRLLCKQNGGYPNERIDYGNGWRWYDYRVEARQILRALDKADKSAA